MRIKQRGNKQLTVKERLLIGTVRGSGGFWAAFRNLNGARQRRGPSMRKIQGGFGAQLNNIDMAAKP